MVRRDRRAARHGFTLLEAVVVVVVLALAVPAGMRMLAEAGEVRRQGAQTARAVTLGGAVLEQVLADVHAPTIGFDALADSAAYLSTPATGLYDRLDAVAGEYAALGISYTVEIGDLADRTGTTTGDADEDVFRAVTVRVTYDDPDGNELELPVSTIVTDFGS